jgi:hypothetical protein
MHGDFLTDTTTNALYRPARLTTRPDAEDAFNYFDRSGHRCRLPGAADTEARARFCADHPAAALELPVEQTAGRHAGGPVRR